MSTECNAIATEFMSYVEYLGLPIGDLDDTLLEDLRLLLVAVKESCGLNSAIEESGFIVHPRYYSLLNSDEELPVKLSEIAYLVDDGLDEQNLEITVAPNILGATYQFIRDSDLYTREMQRYAADVLIMGGLSPLSLARIIKSHLRECRYLGIPCDDNLRKQADKLCRRAILDFVFKMVVIITLLCLLGVWFRNALFMTLKRW